MKEESCFYSYITLSEEKFVESAKKKSNMSWTLILLSHIIVIINNYVYFVPIPKAAIKKEQIWASRVKYLNDPFEFKMLYAD